MASRASCPRCGSTNFFEENGLTFCENGDQQEGGPRIGEDDGNYGTAGKVNRKKEEKVKQKISKVHRGKKGQRLFILAWQHILWKQCHVLVHEKGLPPVHWTLVREMWTLRLRQLANLPVADAVAGVKTMDETVESSVGPVASDHPTLPDTIALAYLGILLLRRSVGLATIYSYIRKEEICYIRAIRHVPEDLREHLAPEYHSALDTTIIPDRNHLQMAVYRTAQMYANTFNMELPPINWILMLTERIKTLGLPPEIFFATKHIVSLTKYTFEYPRKGQRRRNAAAFPEAQLMSAIVVATKLLHPFDSDEITRHPYSTSEPSAVRMNWEAWLRSHDEYKKNTRSKDAIEPGKEIEVTDADVMKMSGPQLDQYMDWFQRTYADDSEVSGVRGQMLDMFPLSDIQEREKDTTQSKEEIEKHVATRLQSNQAALIPQQAVAANDEPETGPAILRPGQQYRQFRSADELSPAALAFHNEAAELGCLDLDSLLRAVLHTERLLASLQHETRRAEAFGEDVDMDSG